MKEFKNFMNSESIPWTEKDVAGVNDWLKTSIREYVLTSQFGQLTGLRVMAEWDPQVQKALSFLPEAQALEDHAHKVLAEKAEARGNASGNASVQQP